MRMIARVGVIGSTLLAFAGCGPTSGTSAADMALPDLAGPSITLQGVARLDKAGGGQVTVAGATICISQPAGIPCVQSDDSGAFAVAGVPADLDVVLTLSNAGDMGMTYPIHTPKVDTTIHPSALRSNDQVQQTVAAAGIDYPFNGKGVIRVNCGVVGATFTMSPATGKGPIYGNMSGEPDPNATSTNQDGGAIFGNLVPQLYQVTITPPQGVTCAPGEFGWTTARPDTLQAPVLPERLTLLRFDCH